MRKRLVGGLFINMVQRAFALKYLTKTFLVDHEYRVFTDKKYAVDEAVAALTQVLKEAVRNVVLPVEYKPKVAKELEGQIGTNLPHICTVSPNNYIQYTHNFLMVEVCCGVERIIQCIINVVAKYLHRIQVFSAF